jgi:hypothetical protein
MFRRGTLENRSPIFIDFMPHIRTDGEGSVLKYEFGSPFWRMKQTVLP